MLMEIFLGFLVAVILYNLIHHFIVIRGSKKYQLEYRSVTNQIVNEVVDQINNEQIMEKKVSCCGSSVLSDIWGREILVFEYEFDFHKSSDNIQMFITAFKEKLSNYCIQNGILYRQHSKVEMIDNWQYDHVLHIDIAFLGNDATFEYIRDLRRLE